MVLPPFIFTRYASVFQSKFCHLQNYPVDSSCCVFQRWTTEYREPVVCFVTWCGNNHFILKVKKAKELPIYCRVTGICRTLFPSGDFGLHPQQNGLELLQSRQEGKGQTVLKLWSFSVCRKKLYIFCKSVLECILPSSVGVAASEQVI